MTIFSNEAASILQYFTFPFEVIGLTLAAIEVRFPATANRLDSYFTKRSSIQEVKFKVAMKNTRNEFWVLTLRGTLPCTIYLALIFWHFGNINIYGSR